MSKNKKVMSLAIKPELHDKLKNYAKQKHMSVSEFVGDLAERAMKIDVDEDPIIVGKPIDSDIIALVLKIPASLKGNETGLQKWMDAQSAGIVKALSGKKTEE
ncbi:hypothetical protein GF389_05385 [Candidatus Dojkabacteria bacterium]|nr:hypothetical protein [Candidatus Dojkabacteria bacterium]